jgi:hypothetical protein
MMSRSRYLPALRSEGQFVQEVQERIPVLQAEIKQQVFSEFLGWLGCAKRSAPLNCRKRPAQLTNTFRAHCFAQVARGGHRRGG